jgi:hypothetical protein
MGYNVRNDEIRGNVDAPRLGAERSALATVRRFNAILSAKGYVRSVTAIPRALVSKPSLGSERRRRRRR